MVAQGSGRGAGQTQGTGAQGTGAGHWSSGHGCRALELRARVQGAGGMLTAQRNVDGVK